MPTPRTDLPRFHVPALSSPGSLATLDADESRHALTVLRLRPGDRVILFDGRGRIAHAHIAHPGESQAHSAQPRTAGPAHPPPHTAPHRQARRSPSHAAATIDELLDVPPPRTRLMLICPAPKGPRLEWLIEKTTELGVTRLVLASFERSVVHPGDTAIDRLRRRSLEACKQCERAWLMEITGPLPLARALDEANSLGAPILIAHPSPTAIPLGAWLHQSNYAAAVQAAPPSAPDSQIAVQSPRALAVIIGPEGGLSPTELELLQRAHGTCISLGETILRVETAAIAIAAAVAAA